MKWNLVNGKANVDKKRTDGGKLRGNSLVCGRVECGKKIEEVFKMIMRVMEFDD